MNGVINLNGYLSSRSFDRMKNHFYLYDKLYTYNFYEFEDLSLNSMYGKPSHFEKVKLLVDQGFIEVLDNQFDLKITDDMKPLIEFINNTETEYQTSEKTFSNKVKKLAAKECDENEMMIAQQEMMNIGWNLHALQERLFGLTLSKKLNEKIFPTLTLDCYKALEIEEPKSFIYRILIDNMPVPDDSIPLVDIIQYRNDNSNQLRFQRLQSWVNKFSKEGLNEIEIQQEIEYLIAEYRNEMKLAGMKMKVVRLEFCCKIIPFFLEKLIKLKFSELTDPFFKLRYEKVSLLQDEINAKGSELAYIVDVK